MLAWNTYHQLLYWVASVLTFHKLPFRWNGVWDESVGVPQPKRWIVFMESRASKCLEDIRAKFATCLMHALRCMFDRGMFDRCVIFGRRHCLLIHRYPNIIKIVGEYLPWMVSIRILIHRQFNLNVTMVQSNIPPFVDFTRQSGILKLRKGNSVDLTSPLLLLLLITP